MANTPVAIAGANTLVGYSITVPFTTTDVYTFSFPYLDQADFTITVASETVLDVADYVFTSDYLIQLTTTGVTKLNGLYGTSLVTIPFVIARSTTLTSRLVDFEDGANLTEEALDLNANQAFYLIQESHDALAIGNLAFDPVSNNFDANGSQIVDLGYATQLSAAASLDVVLDNVITPNYLVDQDYRQYRMVFESGILYRANKDIVVSPASIDLADWDVVLDASDLTQIATNTAKLLTIESGATADQTGAEIKTAYELEANAFTDAQFTKLATIETSATADQTGAEIKTAYELEANAFTDAQFTKLAGIETAATADQTGAEIKIAYEGEADTNAFTNAYKTKVDDNATNLTTHEGDTSTHGVTEVAGVTETQTFTNKTTTNLVQNGTASGTAIKDEDDFISNSDTHLATQQSIKAYIASQVGATPNKSVVSKVTTYTVTTTDDVVLVDSSGGAYTVTLYTAVGNSGKIVEIIKTTDDFTLVTIDGDGSETIRGATTFKMATLNESLKIISDGTNWQVLNHSTGYLSSYIPTFSTGTKGTIGKDICYISRRGSRLKFDYYYQQTANAGASNGSGYYGVGFPSGLIADAARHSIGTNGSKEGVLGSVVVGDSSLGILTGTAGLATTSTFYMLVSDNGAAPDFAGAGSGYGNFADATVNYSLSAEVYIEDWEE